MKNFQSTIIVRVKVLVRLLLFCLARNYDSNTILIPIVIVVVTLWLSGIIVNGTFILRPRYWPGSLLVNADAEIKAP